MRSPAANVALRHWADGDERLLHRLLGDPAMMEHLGGPEPPEKIRDRHRRYVAMSGADAGRMFVITIGPDAEPAGFMLLGVLEFEYPPGRPMRGNDLAIELEPVEAAS